jgi:selenide,water dikinase
VLQQLPRFDDPNLLVGGETSDDAGVYRLNSEQALVLTLDVLTPVCDDPATFGRIAAANSLSDVYAMGGRPLAALCFLGFPSGEIAPETVQAILSGVWEKVKEAGAVIAGGHTMKDGELKCGLSVTGLVHPGRVLTNARARPGDALILTKPLGSGIITTALRANAAPAPSVDAANRVMGELNRTAAETVSEFEVSAVTDITGFGLLGHAWEMASASRVEIRIDSANVPLIPGASELAAQFLFPAGSVRNHQFMTGRATYAAGVPETTQLLLCDAQTSGGLLVSLPGTHAPELLARLHQAGILQAALVGCVEHGEGRIRVT